MKPEIKKLWVDALRSGEFKQGENYLNTLEGMCCLGVLCEIHRVETGEGEWIDIRSKGRIRPKMYKTFEETSTTILTETVYNWAGLPSTDPELGIECASGHNDGGKTFLEIADLIEENL